MAELKSNGDFNCITIDKTSLFRYRYLAFGFDSVFTSLNDWEMVHMEEMLNYNAEMICDYFLTVTHNIATWKLEPQLFMDHLDFEVL